MWKCPVCDQENTAATVCPTCGYDRTCDYERYPTAFTVKRATPTHTLRRQWREKQGPALMELVAEWLFDPDDGSAAERCLRRPADGGDPTAQYWLGIACARGWGAKKDEVQAAQWFDKSARQGYVPARLELGNCFRFGVGVDKDVYTAREYARNAVELALGRGGDQAVIKNKEKQIFYGGNSAGTENNTRVRARLVAYALKEMIEEADRVLIMGHANPDLDCFGAALGLYRAAAVLKKPAHIVMSDEHPAVADLYQRVKNERNYGDVIIGKEQALHQMKEGSTLLILADVNRPSITQAPELLKTADHIAVIDHHRSSEEQVEHVDISYVEPYASSASEMVTELLQYMVENLKLKQVEMDGLFAGIALDTKNFTVKTGVRTFEAAAYLRRCGADSVSVRQMFKNDMEEYKARAGIVSAAHIINGNMAIAGWKGGIENASAVAAQAADELLDIRGIESSYVLTQMGDQINISARSLGKINVQLIMEELGGGGHMTVAGAQLRQTSLEEAEEKVVAAIQAVLERKA